MTTKPTERDIVEQVGELLAKATEGPFELIAYEHGGGRLYREGESRELIADFYNEGDRELYSRTDDLLRRLVAEVKDLRAANISKLLSEIKDRLTPEEGEQFQSLLMAATRGWVTEVTERSEVDRGLLEVFKDMPKRKRRRR